MPRRKPAGWPKYMVERRLAAGAVAYYWAPPTWAAKAECPQRSTPLGSDYAAAKTRCDDILNPHFAAWRAGREIAAPGAVTATFDWLVSVYKRSPRYRDLPAGTRADYDRALNDASAVMTKDGRRRFGDIAVEAIVPAAVDRIFERLKTKPDGTPRLRSAVLSMTVCKLAWNVARRAEPKRIPTDNPFANMRMKYKAKPTRPVTHDELVRFVAAADNAGEASLGTAAMIAYYWLQRQVDILTRLSWTHYRPDGAAVVKVWHHKTGVEIDLPLIDDDGAALWPELMARLEITPRRGTLIVMRDVEDRRRKAFLPWAKDYFRHRVAAIRDAAGIDKDVKFMGLRHGGNTEAADADLTDAQIRALSGHKSAAIVQIYAKATMKQRREGARKRRDERTKGEALSK